MDEVKQGYLYVLVDYNCIDTYKIGVTCRPIQQRLKEINQNPGSCIKLKYLSPLAEDYKIVEKKLHKFFKNCNTFVGENKSLSEWFYLPGDRLILLGELLRFQFGTTFE